MEISSHHSHSHKKENKLNSNSLLRSIRELKWQKQPLRPKLETKRQIQKTTIYQRSRSAGKETSGELVRSVMECCSLTLGIVKSQNLQGDSVFREPPRFQALEMRTHRGMRFSQRRSEKNLPDALSGRERGRTFLPVLKHVQSILFLTKLALKRNDQSLICLGFTRA